MFVGGLTRQDDTEAGDRREIALPLWDEKRGDWHVEPGRFTIAVGASSRDLRRSATITLG